MVNQQPLTIRIAPENKAELRDIYIICRTYIDIGQSIPTSVVHRLFDLMEGPQDYELKQQVKQVKNAVDKVMERLKNMKGYQFDWQDIDPFNIKSTVPINTNRVFAIIITAFFDYQRDYPKAGKDESIAFFYWAFEEEYKSRMAPADQEKFTEYKQAVISGIMSMSVGFRLSSKGNITNEEIFQATRNPIKKYKARSELLF